MEVDDPATGVGDGTAFSALAPSSGPVIPAGGSCARQRSGFDVENFKRNDLDPLEASGIIFNCADAGIGRRMAPRSLCRRPLDRDA